MMANADYFAASLENGSHEFEIVEFLVGNTTYGINVAKVREVINILPVTKMPNTHKYIDGVFTLRGKVMPLINLATCLNVEETKPKRIIISEFNNNHAGFLVDEVSRIQRVAWNLLEAAPEVANSKMVVGVIKMPDKVVVLLDFERVLAEINPDINKVFSDFAAVTDNALIAKRSKQPILIVEDSPLLQELLQENLHKAGYTNTITTKNGKEAWDKIQRWKENQQNIFDTVKLIITDIEMPQMDGHSLLKLIRESQQLKEMPVIIFSSIINDENRKKAKALQANAIVSKPELDKLISIIETNIKE